MSEPFVSVVIPHYHDLPRLKRCLDALGRQTYPANGFEVIVADNGSPEGEEAVAAVVAGRARLVMAPEKGAGPARNAGAAAAGGEILAFTDADCLPEPGWLEAGVAALESSDFAGGAMTVIVESEVMSGAEAFEVVFAFDNAAYVRTKGFTVTANLFCPREVFEAVGGFRVGLSEDLEWSHRARGQGYRIGYAPDAIVGHPARRDWGELLAKWRRLNAETLQLYLEKPNGRWRWFTRSLAVPFSAVVHTPRVLRNPRLPNLSVRIAALGTLYRLRAWRGWDGLRLLAGGRAT